MKHLAITILAILSTYATAQNADHLCFNEIMQSNVDSYYVEYEFPDSWIELYNPTDTAINLQNYRIKTNSGVEYRIPTATTINAKRRVVILCDKTTTGLHTNFRLESTKAGTLFLYDKVGNLVDSLCYPPMLAPNIAYGRIRDGYDTWGWEFLSTPGKANSGGISASLLPNPVFSMAGQVMSNPSNVSITLPNDSTIPSDTKIYITLNGAEPNIMSLNDTAFTLDVQETTVIRAKLISKSALSRPSISQSYIFHPRETQIPIIALSTDSDYLYSSSMGILSSSTTNKISNYKYNWRRPLNVEYLGTKNETFWFNQLGEVAVGGGATRALSQKTLKVYANKRFGTKRFNGVLWPEKPNVTKVKSFMLRNGGNAFNQGRINDAFVQRLFGIHVQNLDYQAYSPVIGYINGKYAGIYGLRERSDEDYVEANYGLEDIDMATHLSYLPSVAGIEERKNNTFGTVYSLYRGSAATYDKMAALIDVDNFMKALIAQMYVPNHDYPHNNVSMWRPLEDGGKWRWILKDLDYYAINDNTPYEFNMFKYMFGTPSANDFEYKYLTATVKEARKIYTKMISFSQFKNKFIDAFATYLGDFLKPSVSGALAKSMRAEIQEELDWTMDLYGCGDELEESMYFFNEVIEHTKRRPAIIYQQMANYFKLGKVIPMSLNPKGLPITINDIELTEGIFDGAYFSDRALRLNSNDENYGWKLVVYNKDENGNLIHDVDADSLFESSNIMLNLGSLASCDSVSFVTYAIHPSDFDIKLEELSIDPSSCTDWSNSIDITLEEPKYAYANITEIDALPTSKTDNLQAIIDFYDNAGNRMRKKILLNLQGNSNPKNNFSIQFCEDEWIGEIKPTISFGNWVPQDEFHLKAFYNDGLRGTAEVAYQLYSKITDRSNCYPQAFPLSLYINGEFYGLMSWQLKKHRANMGLAKDNSSNVWIDGKINDSSLFQDSINWSKFEVRNPKNLYNMDGSEYNGDYPQEIIDASSTAFTGKNKMVRCAEAKQHIIELSHYCNELQQMKDNEDSEESIKQAIEQRFDVAEIINYKIFSLITNNYDGFSENWQWFTYDGKQWTVAPYDCNLTFGYNEEGTSLWPANQSSKKYDYHMEKTDSVGPMAWIKEYYWEDLTTRYAELRDEGIINTANIATLVNNWYNRIGANNYNEEWCRWPESPCISFSDDPNRFETWLNERIALEDEYLGYIADSMTYELAISQAEWGTLCVPFAFEVPTDLEVFTINEISKDGTSLILEKVEYPIANKPYLVHGPQGMYSLSGEIVAKKEDQQLTNKLLVGTFENCLAPYGSYVLQRKQDILGFYFVNSDNIQIPAYHAYLSTPTSSNTGHFRFSNDDVYVDHIFGEEPTIVTSYNYSGQTIKDNTSGFLIRRMQDGSFRKIIIINK